MPWERFKLGVKVRLTSEGLKIRVPEMSIWIGRIMRIEREHVWVQWPSKEGISKQVTRLWIERKEDIEVV